jgi:ABC-type multidrug transport system ATPase subunit
VETGAVGAAAWSLDLHLASKTGDEDRRTMGGMNATITIEGAECAECPPNDLTTTTKPGLHIDAYAIGVERRGRSILRDVDLSIAPGELVAVIGASGAGKSTLLDAIAGVRPPMTGRVEFDGIANVDPRARDLVGYVPQDDLIHRELPVAETLRYAARLRMPSGTPRDVIDDTVATTLEELDLVDRASVRVADLSGGQRKRVSIAVELLTRPRALFLDEPTSGLDPATAANLLVTLRRLADHGTTVLLTTHNTEDLRACDRLVVVAGGQVAFAGSVDQARAHFAVEHLADLYLRIPTTPVQEREPTTRPAPPSSPGDGAEQERRAARRSGPGLFATWRALAGRNVSILRHNRLTMAIMLGAPALVIGMFTMLFRPGALDRAQPDATAAVSTTYWMAFAAFFFGLTYGLLQICTELSIVRREVFIGVRIGPYVASKIAVLFPVLALVNVAMLSVLRGLDRLPSLSTPALARLTVTLMLTSLAALALGLLASAAVADPAQATLALPMLCFPAVLFAGAVLPVSTMNIGGRAVSVVVIARWAFEALGRDLGLSSLFAGDHTGQGSALLDQYGATFDHQTAANWIRLALFVLAFLAATAAVLRRRTRP